MHSGPAVRECRLKQRRHFGCERRGSQFIHSVCTLFALRKQWVLSTMLMKELKKQAIRKAFSNLQRRLSEIAKKKKNLETFPRDNRG